ncbi:hypothetical protein BDQ17DRAFT_1344621 [Cyathus striatus]|nr:hypothetical protein BDQ17DRAFT_1344621 [Cyathus striatus]
MASIHHSFPTVTVVYLRQRFQRTGKHGCELESRCHACGCGFIPVVTMLCLCFMALCWRLGFYVCVYGIIPVVMALCRRLLRLRLWCLWLYICSYGVMPAFMVLHPQLGLYTYVYGFMPAVMALCLRLQCYAGDEGSTELYICSLWCYARGYGFMPATKVRVTTQAGWGCSL